MEKRVVETKAELQQIVKQAAVDEDLNYLDVSAITDMSYLFDHSDFNGDISEWDVSNVTNMDFMFHWALSFNQPLHNWDMSNVQSMEYMFNFATSFNQSIDSWDVSRVESMSGMFHWARAFNQPLSNWRVSSVNDMNSMFAMAESFNQSLNSWNVSKVEDMGSMFSDAKAFNQPLSNWDVSRAWDLSLMFSGAISFNQPLDAWSLSDVKDMQDMLKGADSFSYSSVGGCLLGSKGPEDKPPTSIKSPTLATLLAGETELTIRFHGPGKDYWIASMNDGNQGPINQAIEDNDLESSGAYVTQTIAGPIAQSAGISINQFTSVDLAESGLINVDVEEVDLPSMMTLADFVVEADWGEYQIIIKQGFDPSRLIILSELGVVSRVYYIDSIE